MQCVTPVHPVQPSEWHRCGVTRLLCLPGEATPEGVVVAGSSAQSSYPSSSKLLPFRSPLAAPFEVVLPWPTSQSLTCRAMKDLTGLLVCCLFGFTGQRAFWIREHIGLIDHGTPQLTTHPQMHPAGWMNWATTICQVKRMLAKLFKKYWIVLQKHSYVVKYKMTCYVYHGCVSCKNKNLTRLKSEIQHRWLRKFRTQHLSTRW